MILDIVREILENRAELYRALYREKMEESAEEEGYSQDDINLEEHLMLKEELAKKMALEGLKKLVS